MAAPVGGQVLAPQPANIPITNQLRDQLGERVNNDPVVHGLVNVVQQIETDRGNLSNQINTLNNRVNQLSQHTCGNCCVTQILCYIGCCTSPVHRNTAIPNAVTVVQTNQQR